MSTTLSLYEIDQRLQALIDAMIEAGGDVTDELADEFADVLEMHTDKAESYIAVINDLALTAEAVKAEETRLRDRRRALERSAQEMKDRLCHSMRSRGIDKLETNLGTIRVQQASTPSVRLLVDAESLPSHFQRVKVRPDNTALRHAIEDGDDVAAQLATLEYSHYVRIY